MIEIYFILVWVQVSHDQIFKWRATIDQVHSVKLCSTFKIKNIDLKSLSIVASFTYFYLYFRRIDQKKPK